MYQRILPVQKQLRLVFSGLFFSLILLGSGSLQAVKVCIVSETPPLAFYQNTKPKGLMVDLLGKIASHNGWDLEYVDTPRDADILIGYTLGQNPDKMYSHAFMAKEWGLLTLDKANNFWTILSSTFLSLSLSFILIFFICLVLTNMAVYRKMEAGQKFDKRPFFLSLWSLLCLGYGVGSIQDLTKNSIRYLTIPWIFIAMIFFNMLTGIVGSTFILAESGGKIRHLNDMQQKTVGVLKGAPINLLQQAGARIKTVTSFSEGEDLLREKKIDALGVPLTNLPPLEDLMTLSPLPLQGGLLAFAAPLGSPFLGPLNDALEQIKLTEDFQTLCSLYLGQLGGRQCLI